MTREVIATGKDVSDAIDNGCAQLGVDREKAEFEIINLPKKAFFGLKTIPAKVRVYVELPDIKPAPVAPKPAAKPAQPKVAAPKPAPQPPKKPAPQQAKPAQPKPQAPKPVQQAKPVAPKPVEAEKAKPAVENKVEKPAVAPQTENKSSQKEIVPTDIVRKKVETATEYLKEIMVIMGYDSIEITPAYYEENVCLKITGASLGGVIGRRGETLDALQYLTSLVTNREEGDYIRVNIDTGNYREKRERTLTALSRKIANQVMKTGKSVTLEPMNPYERRVIHGAISQISGVKSTSTGVDPARRVVVEPAEGARRPQRSNNPRYNKNDKQRSGKPGGRGGYNSKPYTKREDTKKPEDSNSIPHPAGEPVEKAASRDADLLAGVASGVPIVGGTKVERPVVEKKQEKPKEKVADGPRLYGKL